MLFVLNAHRQPVQAASRKSFERYFLGADRTIAYDTLGPYVVHTVFCGVSPPEGVHHWLFVTSVDGPGTQPQRRYKSWVLAENGHKAIVEGLQALA